MSNNDWLEWIDLKNTIQCEWATQYIRKNTSNPWDLPPILSKENICLYNNYLTNNYFRDFEELSSLIKHMKDAWRQKKHRSAKNDKKSYSFMMSESIHNKLKKISADRKTTITDTLEEIINQENQTLINYKFTMLRVRKGFREKVLSLNNDIDKRKNTIKELKSELKEKKEIITSMKLRIAKLENETKELSVSKIEESPP